MQNKIIFSRNYIQNSTKVNFRLTVGGLGVNVLDMRELTKSINLLQLSETESKAIRLIKRLPEKSDKQIDEILLKFKLSIKSYIRLAIYCQPLREWCFKRKWTSTLQKVEKLLQYKYKPQPGFSVFQWIVNLYLEDIAKNKPPQQKIFLLFIAMEMFGSVSATSQISDIVLKMLALNDNEKLIFSMIKNLEKCAHIHGVCGYFIYSLFCNGLGKQILGKSNDIESSLTGHFYLRQSYILLVTAYKLMPHCEAALSNVILGRSSQFLDMFDGYVESKEQKIPFIPMLLKYKEQNPAIKDIEPLAWSEAKRLSEQWLTSSRKFN